MEFTREFFYDEVRAGFYIPGLMKRAWGAELIILSEIDRICKKYDISYCLFCGTLLGAVRHGEFIPWDDDIDIMMRRDDFTKFVKIAEKELSKDLLFSSLQTRENYCNWIASIGIRETDFQAEMMSKFCEFPYFAVVDIFVFDDLAKNPEEEKYRRQILGVLMSMVDKIKRNEGETKSFQKDLDEVEELLKIRLDRKKGLEGQLFRIIDRIFQAFNGSVGDSISCLPLLFSNPEYTFSRSLLAETKTLSFCGLPFPVPGEYDALLRLWFGDYHKNVMEGGDHEYPYYKNFEKYMKDRFTVLKKLEYSFSQEDLSRERVWSFRELAINSVELWISFSKSLFQDFLSGNLSTCLSKLSNSQNDAITLGQAIEKKKGEGTESVSILEKYCEVLYEVYQDISACISLETQCAEISELSEDRQVRIERVVKSLPPQMLKKVEEKFEQLSSHLTKLRSAVEREFKKQVVFLPHSAKHFDSLCPLVHALMQTKEVECKVIPIPYFDRSANGGITEMHFEGEKFPKDCEIIDYKTYDFALESPDCIVINSPYDEFNPVFTIDPFFYSREMKKYTNKLVYIPWFVTAEINPEKKNDEKAFYNMKYYVTVPGIFHADLTIVQSKEMRKAYLTKISQFTNKDIKRKMSHKISGAGSCLFGDKEGQGVKEVAEELLRFINKS